MNDIKENKRYEIYTIGDIVDVVNEENLERFIKDFHNFLFVNINLIKLT